MSIKNFNDTIAWYDNNAAAYAKASETYYDLEHIKAFADLLFPQANALDAGCGPGRDSNLLAQQNLNVTGLDLSHGLIEVAKKRFPHITFLEGNMLSLPFSDAHFDGVWSNTSLLHLETTEEVEQALAEICRVLKPQGVLHVLVKAQVGTEKTAIAKDKLSNHERFFQYFTLEELRLLLEKTGFSLVSIKQYSEIERIPHGRPEVELIWALARKS